MNKALGLLDDVNLRSMPFSSLPQANPDAWPVKRGRNVGLYMGQTKHMCMNTCMFCIAVHHFARSKIMKI